MTPDRLRQCIDALGWSQRGLAGELGRPEGTVRQWARGATQIPDDVAAWLDAAAAFAGPRLAEISAWRAANPPPARGASE